MGDRLGILGAVGFPFSNHNPFVLGGRHEESKWKTGKRHAPGEARTHGLQIMRLTRCLLRYRGG